MLRNVCLLVWITIEVAGAASGGAPSFCAPHRPGTDGGPDAWGYAYFDSDTSVNPAHFNWIDVRSVGQRVTDLVDDNVAGPFNVGFEFPFYWGRFSSFYVGSNGYVSFGDGQMAAYPFADIPNSARPNNVIAALESDLDFTGLAGNKGCWYWTNFTADTCIIQCESVPFWSSGHGTGNNTFEIILSKMDSGVTLQYQEQSGAPSSGWVSGAATVGIENVTGLVGLRYLYGGTPNWNNIHAGLAVHFKAPANPNYTYTDVMLKYAMSNNSGGMFLNYPSPQPLTVWGRFVNSGTQPVSDVPLSAEIRRVSNGALLWSGSGSITAMPVGFETTYSFGNWSPIDTSAYSLKVKAGLGSDQYHANDSVVVKIRVIGTDFPSQLSYDASTTGWFGLSGAFGAGTRFVPPSYPVMVCKTYFDFSRGGDSIDVYLCSDGGPAHTPDSLLDHRAVLGVAGWDSIDFSTDSLMIQHGGFLVGYRTRSGNAPNVAYDAGLPLSRQNWEWTGSWTANRYNESQDLRIRVQIAQGRPSHNLGVTQLIAPVNDLDSNQSVAPVAHVQNFGMYNEGSAVATFTISSSPPYREARTFSLNHGRDTLITFPGWTARPGLNSIPRCSVWVNADQDPANDTLTGFGFNVYYQDPGIRGISRPDDTVDFGQHVAPLAQVCNYGNTAEDVPARLRIAGTSYDRTASVRLGAGEIDTLAFPDWVADTLAFAATCSTEFARDMNHANDRCARTFFVRYLDAGATMIIAPQTADSGALTPVQARVRNYSNVPASFDVRFAIPAAGYASTRSVSLPARAEANVNFDPWVPVRRGSYQLRCSTLLASDWTSANDLECDTVSVRVHDVSAQAIIAPGPLIPPGSIVPQASVRNNGALREAVDVTFKISSSPAYLNTVHLADGLPTGLDTCIRFAPWNAVVGTYSARCSTFLASDETRENDTASRLFRVSAIDVGVAQIPFPTDTLDTSAVIVPQARVRNSGLATASFHTAFRVYAAGPTLVYSSTASITALPASAETTISFAEWPKPHPVAAYQTRCSTWCSGDINPGNDTLGGSFIVATLYGTPGWARILDLPPGARSKSIKDGAGLAYGRVPGNDTPFVYAFKGNNTCEFYRYNTLTNAWHALDSMPLCNHEQQKKAVKKGAALACALNGHVYAFKGNGTYDLWEYAPSASTPGAGDWTQLDYVPVGGKSLREGAGAAAVRIHCAGAPDTDFVYLLKGSGTCEFYRFNTVTGDWHSMASAPLGTSGKPYKNGSCLAYDGADTIFCLKGSYNEFAAYSISSGRWQTRETLPRLYSPGSSKKKVKDGAGIVCAGRTVFALKGGGTDELWSYDCDQRKWYTAAQMSGGSRTVKAGGALVAAADRRALYAFRGNNTREFWQYGPINSGRLLNQFSGVQPHDVQTDSSFLVRHSLLTVSPDPLTSSISPSISYSLPFAGHVSLELYDISGRLMSRLADGYHSAGSYTCSLPPAPCSLAGGVYLLKLAGPDGQLTQKLVIE